MQKQRKRMVGYRLLGLILPVFLLSGCSFSTTVNPGGSVVGSNKSSGAGQGNAVGTQLGNVAPAFQLQTIDGTKTVTLQSLLGGKPIILNAWASWCPPCRAETPDLVSLSKKYAGVVQIIGIDMTQQEATLAAAQQFVQQYHIPYPVLKDPHGAFMNTYNILGFPTSYLLSPSGRILAVQQGGFKSQELNDWINIARTFT